MDPLFNGKFIYYYHYKYIFIMSGLSGIVYDSTFNTDFSANKLRHGDLNLQNGAFTMYNGKTSAYFSIQNDGKIWINSLGQFMSISMENLKLLKDISIEGPTLGDIQIWTQGIRHNTTATDATEIGRGGLTIKGTRFKSDTYALFMSDVSINGILNANKDVSFNSKLFVNDDVSFNSKLMVMLDVSLNSRIFVNNDVSFNSKLMVMSDVSLNSRLFVNNDVSFNSKLFVNNDVSLNSRLFVNNDVSFNSKLMVMLDVSLNSRLFVNNDVSFNSKLFVNNDVSLNSRLFVNNDVSFNSKLFVNNDTSFNSRLFVNNDVSFNSKFMVMQDVSLNSRLFVNNDVSFNSKLMVMQDVSFNSRLFVGHDVSFNSKLFVKNFVSIGKSLPLMSLDISYADGIRLPTGTTDERSIKTVGTGTGFTTQNGTSISVADKSLYVGTIRYNTTNSQFEGFGPGDSWGSLGGVINVAQNTKIIASSPNADSTNNELIFYTAPKGSLVTGDAVERMRILANGDVSINKNIFVGGDVSLNSNLTVVGNVKIENTLTFKKQQLANGGIITPIYSLVEINGGTSNMYSLSDGHFDGQTIKIVSNWVDPNNSLRVNGKICFDASSSYCVPIIFKNAYQSFDATWTNLPRPASDPGNGVWIVTAWKGVNYTNSNITFGTNSSGDIQMSAAGNFVVSSPAKLYDHLYMNNATNIYAKNLTNADEVFLIPRFSDNVTYLNYGSGGFNIRNNSSVNSIFVGNDGRVGIGTITPAAGYKLDVNGTASATRFIGKNGGVASHIAWHNATEAFNESSSVFYGIGTISDHMTFSANQTIAQATTTPSMKLSASGNLTAYGFKSIGNGSTAASTQADFNGDGTANHNLLLVSTKANSGVGTTPYSMALGVDFASGCGYINAAGNSAIQPVCLQTRGGNVGIGQTNPATRLHVNGLTGSLLTLQNDVGGGSASVVNIDFFNSTFKAGSIQCKNLATGTWSSQMSFFVAINNIQLYEAIRITGLRQNEANCCDIKIFGDVESVSYNAVSDYRVKENIKPLDASFNVDVLNPVTYNLKSSGKQDIGFIAHEVQEFYPYLVNGVKDGPETQSLNYNGLIGILTKEIKDLKKEMRLVNDANTKLNSDVSVLRLKLEAESKANTKLNEDFSKLSSEMSVLRDIVQELMPL